MGKIEGLKISETEYPLPNGEKGKLAVLIYLGGADPRQVLDYAVSEYVEYEGYHELIDANLDNPWMRVLLSEINQLKSEDFDEQKHKLKNPISDD